MTLADHAAAWWTERGFPMPANKTSIEWITMYEYWANWAFSNLQGGKNDDRRE